MVLKPAKRDINPDAKSHAGQHGDFSIVWLAGSNFSGWYVSTQADPLIGPFHTSQAAFGAVKDAIDSLIEESTR